MALKHVLEVGDSAVVWVDSRGWGGTLVVGPEGQNILLWRTPKMLSCLFSLTTTAKGNQFFWKRLANASAMSLKSIG